MCFHLILWVVYLSSLGHSFLCLLYSRLLLRCIPLLLRYLFSSDTFPISYRSFMRLCLYLFSNSFRPRTTSTYISIFHLSHMQSLSRFFSDLFQPAWNFFLSLCTFLPRSFLSCAEFFNSISLRFFRFFHTPVVPDFFLSFTFFPSAFRSLTTNVCAFPPPILQRFFSPSHPLAVLFTP